MEKITALSSLELQIAATSVVALWAYGLAALRFPTTLLTSAVQPTDVFAWDDQVVQGPPRSTPRRRRPKKEKTRPVSNKTTNVVLDPAELEGYNPPYADPTTEVAVGDVTQTDEHPLFEQDPREALNVTVNVSYARFESGTRAIRVVNGTGQVLLQLTAAQAHQLAVDLHDTADIVGEIRQKAGFLN